MRKLFRISWNRDDPMIMNFPPRRLLEIEIDTHATYIDTYAGNIVRHPSDLP